MDIVIFLFVCFIWISAIAFRRFHHYQGKNVIKNASTLIGYWGSYEGRSKPESHDHQVEYAALAGRIFERIKSSQSN